MSDCPADRCLLSGNHKAHFDGGEWWDNDAYTPPASQSFRPGRSRASRVSHETWDKMSQARRRATPEERVVDGRTMIVWTEDGWVEHAWDVLTNFLGDHPGPFTTPENLWPLLPDPQPDVDRRALVRVIRRALREKAIVEIGGKRLRDTYRTADGSEFQINKIVPTYQRAAR